MVHPLPHPMECGCVDTVMEKKRKIKKEQHTHYITSIISGTDCISISSKFKSLGSARALYAFPNLTHFSNLALFCWSVPLLHLRASFSIRLKAEPRTAPGSFSISAPTKPVTPWSIAKKCSIFFWACNSTSVAFSVSKVLLMRFSTWAMD